MAAMHYNAYINEARRAFMKNSGMTGSFSDYYDNQTTTLKNAIDAYCLTYADLRSSFDVFGDRMRYQLAPDSNLYNWSAARDMFYGRYGDSGTLANFAEPGFQNDLFSQFFNKDNAQLTPKEPGTTIFDLSGQVILSPNQKSKLIAGLQWSLQGALNNMSDTIKLAEKTLAPVDPLIIDLDGDGIETTGLQNGIMMDHQSDGFAELSSWVDTDDGIIVHDKNNNGIIDNGNEIFGDNYIKENGTKASSGFDALSDFDSNQDGVVNNQDANFSSLKVLKGDGTLLTMDDAGISSINLSSQNKNTQDENGNILLTQGSYTKTNGQTGIIGDYALQSDTMISIASDYIDVSEEIAQMPDIEGYGTLYSLQQAMAHDSTNELKELIQEYIDENNSENKKELVTEIIYKWTGAEDIAANSRGEDIDARQLYALEKFMGRGFVGVEGTSTPNSEAANILKGAFSQLHSYIFAQLESQTELKTLYEKITIGENGIDLTGVQNQIDAEIAVNPTTGKQILSDFVSTFLNLGLSENSNYNDFYSHYSDMSTEYQILMDTAGKLLIYGTDVADNITGTAEAEAVFANDGNDTIYTRQGNDIVYGGAGDDYIDTCENDDMIFGEDGNDTIKAGYGNDTIYGGAGNDNIDTGDGNELVYGGDGDDTIETGNGTNYIDAGSGNDNISLGYQAAETLIAGTGDDIIWSNYGEKHVIFNKGDGNDIFRSTNGGEIIQLGEDFTPSNLKAHCENLNLIITFNNSDDSITFENFISNPLRFDCIKFSDGTTLSSDDMFSMLEIHGTDGNDSILGSVAGEVIYGYDGNDNINASQDATSFTPHNNDTIYGGAGDDTIETGNGTNYIDAGSGNDYITLGDQATETLIAGTGDDIIWSNYGEKHVIFNKGDGNDIFRSTNGGEIIQLGEDFTPSNLKAHCENLNLIITFNNSDDSITFENFISNPLRFDCIKFSDGTTLSSDDMFSMLEIHGTDGNDSILGSVAGEVIYGYDGNDNINASQDATSFTPHNNDTIYGGAGDDTIETGNGTNYIDAGSGNDYITLGDQATETIIAGTGDDIINSRGGNKLIIFNKGDGNDTIRSLSNGETIQLGDNLTKENFRIKGEEFNATIYFTDSDDTIKLENFLGVYPTSIKEVTFSDGTKYTAEELRSMLRTEGTVNNDSIIGSYYSETIFGYEGNDTISGRQGDDTIYGGSGDDNISGEDGNDIIFGDDGNDTIKGNAGVNYLDGGSGDDYIDVSNGSTDTIIGGLGNDLLNSFKGEKLYIFNQGDGNDTIRTSLCEDTIQFTEGITEDDIIFRTEGNNLFIEFENQDTDSIKIENYLLDDIYEVETLKFSDGTTISNSQINQIIQDMSSYATEQGIALSTVEDVNNNADLMNMVNSAWTEAA